MSAGLGSVGRIFSRDKLVDSRTLNRLGVQVFRTIAARAAYNLRRVPVAEAVSGQVAELRRDGIMVWCDFLAPDHFARVREECAWLNGQLSDITTWNHGPTRLEELLIGRFPESVLPSIHAFYDDPRLRALITAAEKRAMPALAEAGEREYLTQGDPTISGERDPQTELHSDIFFNTHKAWFYLDEVRREDGPLVYVKGSQRLTPARLSFVYRHSWQRDPASDPSRRISPDEQAALDAEETIVTCPANTLVIIDASGYHRRLQGQPGRTRRALHLSVRANPFAPHGLHLMLTRHPALHDLVRRVKRDWIG